MKVKHNIISKLILILFAVLNLQAVFGQIQIEEIIVTAEKREQSLQGCTCGCDGIQRDLYQTKRGSIVRPTWSAIFPICISRHLREYRHCRPCVVRSSGEDGPGLDQPVAMFVDDVYKGAGNGLGPGLVRCGTD